MLTAGLAPAAAADLGLRETRAVAVKRVAVRPAKILLCPDTHCGHRAYPDPYIWDGWRGDRRNRPWPDVRTWYLMRTMPVIYLGETPALVTRDVRVRAENR